MLTGNSPPVTQSSSPFLPRKRHRSCDSVEDQRLTPQAKRSGGGPSLLDSDLDSESSSSDSSNGVSSPERALEANPRPNAHQPKYCTKPEREVSATSLQPCLHSHGQTASYDHINRVLREAHFSSLQTRGCPGST